MAKKKVEKIILTKPEDKVKWGDDYDPAIYLLWTRLSKFGLEETAHRYAESIVHERGKTAIRAGILGVIVGSVITIWVDGLVGTGDPIAAFFLWLLIAGGATWLLIKLAQLE